MAGFTPVQLATVFRALQHENWDAILVGGQAVNIWACHYERDLPAWSELRPYTSRDLDYQGGLAEARWAMHILGAQGRLNTDFDPSPQAGVLTVRLPDGQIIVVDILSTVFGVSTAEVERTAVDWHGTGELAGVTLRVMHPLILLESKVASLRGLPQEGRLKPVRFRCSKPSFAARSCIANSRIRACLLGHFGLEGFGDSGVLCERFTLPSTCSIDTAGELSPPVVAEVR